jgi:hypothetical protein
MSPALSSRLLLGAVLFSTVGLAQAQSDPPKPAATPVVQKDQEKPKEEKKEPEKPKTIDELTKDFTKTEGLVTIYRQTKDKKDTVYLEIPESRLGKLMLIQITSGSGLGDTSAFVFHGMPIADVPVRFQKIDDARIQLITPNLYHRGETPESKRGIARSFPDMILANFDIAANQPDRKSMLVDVTSFFKSDVADLSTAVDSPGGRGGFGLDPSGTRIDTVKNFPENFVIRTVYQLQRKGPAFSGDPKSVPWAVSFNISDLPTDTGYRPRLGDPRVGYFTTTFEDLTDARDGNDPNVNYIMRWNLERADPSLALSPPKKPIVFWIDNAVPQEYRESVRKGILMYNEAFEKMGIKDAIEAKQMPDDADWDIADIRYNMVRWTTGMPFAIALFRANPITGEILNASVNMDAGFASSGAVNFDNIVDPSTGQVILADLDTTPAKPQILKKWAPMLCDIEQRGRDIHAIGMAAAETLTPGFTSEDRERMIKQYITEVVAHEVGHCMGLRHNFAASNQLSMDQLCDPATVKKYGTGASVMDYSPFNAGAIGRRDVDFYSQRIGTYDFWAIEYGYTPVSAGSPQGEVPALRSIASLGSTPGHLYQSDGSADDFDPFVIRFDSARQPLDYLEKMVGFGPRIRERAQMKIKPGESYYKFTQTYLAGWRAQVSNANRAARFVGGGRLATSFKGDANERPSFTPVDGPTQRRALHLVTKSLFSEDAFKTQKKDFGMLTFNPKESGNEAWGRSRMFAMEKSFSSAQRQALTSLLDSDRLTRIKSNEFRLGPAGGAFTVAEMFRTLDKDIWSELPANKRVTDLRRDLQRSYLDLMIPLAVGQKSDAPADARDLAMDDLVSLRTRIKTALPKATDEYTGPHLRQCLARINRALAAQSTVPVGQ